MAHDIESAEHAIQRAAVLDGLIASPELLRHAGRLREAAREVSALVHAPGATGPNVEAHASLALAAFDRLESVLEALRVSPEGSEVEREALMRCTAVAQEAAGAALGLRAAIDDAQFVPLTLEQAQAIARPMVW